MNENDMTPEQALAFERCTDFIARMIIKYGGELDLEELALEKTAPLTQKKERNHT